MRKLLTAALAAGTLVLGAPVAAAAGPYDYHGGCGFHATTAVGSGQNAVTGVLHALAVVFSLGGTDNPVAATIECDVRVDGGTAATLTVSGVTVLAGAQPKEIRAADTSLVEVCETVTFPDSSVIQGCEELPDAAPGGTLEGQPEEMLRNVVVLVRDLKSTHVDPAACPGLAALAGEYGPLRVNEQGDVFLREDPAWDCPPYDVLGGELPRVPLEGTIHMNVGGSGDVSPWFVTGHLALDTLWECSATGPSWGGPGPAQPFRVTCWPRNLQIEWSCSGARAVAVAYATPRLGVVDGVLDYAEDMPGDAERNARAVVEGSDPPGIRDPIGVLDPLPSVTWSNAETYASCHSATRVEQVYSGLANSVQPGRVDSATFNVAPLTQVQCTLDGGPQGEHWSGRCAFGL